jgi:hypothetical protein
MAFLAAILRPFQRSQHRDMNLIKLNPYIHNWKFCKNSLLKSFTQTFFHSGYILFWNNASNYTVYKFKPLSSFKRFNPDMNLSILTMATDCFLCLYWASAFFVIVSL